MASRPNLPALDTRFERPTNSRGGSPTNNAALSANVLHRSNSHINVHSARLRSPERMNSARHIAIPLFRRSASISFDQLPNEVTSPTKDQLSARRHMDTKTPPSSSEESSADFVANRQAEYATAKMMCEYVQFYCPTHQGSVSIVSLNELLAKPLFIQEIDRRLSRLMDLFDKFVRHAGFIDVIAWFDDVITRPSHSLACLVPYNQFSAELLLLTVGCGHALIDETDCRRLFLHMAGKSSIEDHLARNALRVAFRMKRMNTKNAQRMNEIAQLTKNVAFILKTTHTKVNDYRKQAKKLSAAESAEIGVVELREVFATILGQFGAVLNTGGVMGSARPFSSVKDDPSISPLQKQTSFQLNEDEELEPLQSKQNVDSFVVDLRDLHLKHHDQPLSPSQMCLVAGDRTDSIGSFDSSVNSEDYDDSDDDRMRRGGFSKSQTPFQSHEVSASVNEIHDNNGSHANDRSLEPATSKSPEEHYSDTEKRLLQRLSRQSFECPADGQSPDSSGLLRSTSPVLSSSRPTSQQHGERRNSILRKTLIRNHLQSFSAYSDAHDPQKSGSLTGGMQNGGVTNGTRTNNRLSGSELSTTVSLQRRGGLTLEEVVQRNLDQLNQHDIYQLHNGNVRKCLSPPKRGGVSNSDTLSPILGKKSSQHNNNNHSNNDANQLRVHFMKSNLARQGSASKLTRPHTTGRLSKKTLLSTLTTIIQPQGTVLPDHEKVLESFDNRIEFVRISKGKHR